MALTRERVLHCSSSRSSGRDDRKAAWIPGCARCSSAAVVADTPSQFAASYFWKRLLLRLLRLQLPRRYSLWRGLPCATLLVVLPCFSWLWRNPRRRRRRRRPRSPFQHHLPRPPRGQCRQNVKHVFGAVTHSSCRWVPRGVSKARRQRRSGRRREESDPLHFTASLSFSSVVR